MLISTMSNEAKFVDIDDGNTLAHAIVDTVRHPLLVLDEHQNIIAASRSFYRTFQLVSRDVRGHLLYEIEHGQWDIPELRRLLEKIAMDDTAVAVRGCLGPYDGGEAARRRGHGCYGPTILLASAMS